jgi:hypothetical protein
MKPKHPSKLTILGQPSWQLSSDKVTAAVTEQGGHLAPVKFHLAGRVVEPFSVAPWAREKLPPGTPAMLKSLRGDFFCAPFGGNETSWRGEKHPPHGNPANAKWKLRSFEGGQVWSAWHWTMKTTSRPGRVHKSIRLKTGETNLYCRHVLSEMEGPMSFGHHAMLKFPEARGSGIVSTSRILFAQVAPEPFESPAVGGYQSLKPGSRFTRLSRVATTDANFADLEKYPARRGFEDLVMLVHESEPDFAWSAVTFQKERYVWFSLKDPRILRSTILWISNAGRHYPPWNGRHDRVMGFEDVTSYFHYGLAESANPNPVSRMGYATCMKLKKAAPLTVNYIMGVAAIPAKFGRARSITRAPGAIVLASDNGCRVIVKADTDFLKNP